ncbi:MAG TPA: cyclodeaminase/cyclohydrolase family protein [Feifaniaceae bacterium]|nr:cyclodeaminase/cyclohydrolase family protein [Feifaniaceae bacterium]
MLKELKLAEYLNLLASDSPAPGGGSASALCGAQGAALAAMVANLTVSRKKYEAFHAVCAEAAEKAEALRAQLTAQIDRDTDAYTLVCAAMKLPKETEEEKRARADQIAEATLSATEVPYDTMALAVEALETARTLAGQSNPNAASDLGVAACSLETCVKGAWLNVRINLGGVKDARRAKELQAGGEALFHKAEAIAKEIYAAVAASL